MKNIACILILLLGWCFLALSSFGEELRTWTDKQGRTINAAFVKADAQGVVNLKQEDGKDIFVPSLALCLSDRTWLKLKGVNTGSNELMEYLQLNYDAGKKLNELYPKASKIADPAKKGAIMKEIDAVLQARDGYKEEVFELFKSYLPVDTPPFNKYKQDFALMGALTWKLCDEDNKQLGYVSLGYSDKNKELKKSGKNTDKLGIPCRGGWFFFTDKVMLQVTLDMNDTLKADGAQEAFLKKGNIKGLYDLGQWR